LDAVSDPTVIVELRDQLLVWERELDHREKLLLIRDNNVVEAKCSLGRGRMKYDAAHDRTGAVR
jgi:hypothetical protein